MKKKLQDLLNKRTKSLEKVAHEMGVSRQTLYNVKWGKKASLLTTKIICNYFGEDFNKYI